MRSSDSSKKKGVRRDMVAACRQVVEHDGLQVEIEFPVNLWVVKV